MRRVKSFWRKDTKANLKFNNSSKSNSNNASNINSYSSLNPNNPIVPNIIRQTIEYIEENALNEKGLFRVFGNQVDVNSLKMAFEKYETIDLSKISNPHIVTSVLKLYLRELSEPLCTFNSYEALIVSYGISDPEMRVSVIKSIIQKIVSHHYVVLDYLMAFLCRISKYYQDKQLIEENKEGQDDDDKEEQQKHYQHQQSKLNNLDSSNLAMIFAPTLLKSKSETPENLIADSPRSAKIIKILIDNYSEIFEKDPYTFEPIGDLKPLKQFFEEDYLLSSKYETINLDKEIAEIFEEEDVLSKSFNGLNSTDQFDSTSGLLSKSSSNGGGDNATSSSDLNSSSVVSPNSINGKSARPSVFQVFGSSVNQNNNSNSAGASGNQTNFYQSSSSGSITAAGIVSYNGSRLSVISNDSSASSPDISHDIDDDEEEELQKKQLQHFNDDLQDISDNNNINNNNNNNNNNNSTSTTIPTTTSTTTTTNIGNTKEIEFKIQVIKELIDKTILELENEFIQLGKELQDIVSFQEILLVASSLKNIMLILTDGPDVDTQVVSSFEIDNTMVSSDDQQMKRLEILKKAILQKINNSIPSLLLDLKEESSSIIGQYDIERDICLVDLITIMRTLKAVNDVLDFFFSKWSTIALSSSNTSGSGSPQNHSPILSQKQQPVLSSSPSSQQILLQQQQHQREQKEKEEKEKKEKELKLLQKEKELLDKEKQHLIVENTEKEFIIIIKPKEEDIIQNILDIDMVLFEAEETLMGVTSKSELIYIAKVVQNIQKIVRLPIGIQGTFDEIPPPKINTLKITPKHKLAPLVSVVYVLIKEIRDSIIQLKDDFEKLKTKKGNNGTYNNKDLVYYQQRLLDLWRLLSKLPAFNTYKTSYRNRQEISSKNCQYMRETIESTLKKLEPIFIQLKEDVSSKDNVENNLSLDSLMVISRSVTKIKKLFEDSQLYQRTSIKFPPFTLSKSNQISLSTETLAINKDQLLSQQPLSPTTINDKISTLKNLTSSIIDQVILRFNQIEDNFNQINQENYLFEIINILKLVITNFKDIKNLQLK